MGPERAEVTHLVPSLRAIPSLWEGVPGAATVMTAAQRHRITAMATLIELRPRAAVYHAGDAADSVFINGGGVVKAVHDLPNGKRRVVAFWFPHDLFGLAERGRYVYTLVAVTAVKLHRIPVEPLARAFLDDSRLQLQFLRKVTHELREADRQKLLLVRRDAVGRVAAFLSLLEEHAAANWAADRIAVPMSRSDIANYLGLTLEAVSRATRALTSAGILRFLNRHTVRILDRGRFDELVTRG